LIARFFPAVLIHFDPGITLMSGNRTRPVLLAVAGALGIVAGCSKDAATENTNTGGPPMMSGGPGMGGKVFDADSGPYAAGKKVMVSSGCFRCHAVDGAKPAGGMPGPPGPGGPGGPGGPPNFGPGGPPRGGMGGPDLAKVAQNPEHTTEWLTQYVQNPKSMKPNSKMPAFEGKMSEEDLKALVEYLASLK
jgi:mono/diheme cytochrome c family protein